ncbi:hypothetical protein GCM10022200_17670 [Microbacterium awajiense]|uniref:DUF624 domain-containing protein n=1 Tax=Microbacterium awajiense TaxID=415214 RepID=A0ABP7AKM0_9MICO
MDRRRQPRKRGAGWEGRLLAALSYPANLIFGAVAALALALPVITALASAIALARAFRSWSHDDDDRVFTNTFREFAATWRRSLPLSVVATLVLGVIAADLVFLAYQLSDGGSGVGVIVGAMALPVAAVCPLYALAVAAAAAALPDATARGWLGGAGRLMFSSPGRSFGVFAVAAATAAIGVILPTLLPFIVFALPVYAAVRLWLPRPPEAAGPRR